MKTTRTILVFALTAFISVLSYSQDKPQGVDDTRYLFSNPNSLGDPTKLVTVQPKQQVFDAEKTALLNEIREARLSNNTRKAQELQRKLSGINGDVIIPQQGNDPLNSGLIETQQFRGSRVPFNDDPDYNVSAFHFGSEWAVATQTSSKSSAVFAAVTSWHSSQCDTIRVYCSYNGGVTWVQKGVWFSGAAGIDFRSNELDIEPIINGADTLLYLVAGYDFNSHAWSGIWRFNIGTGVVSSQSWQFGGWSDVTVNTYNPRIVSDNTNYGADSYVYISVTHDSLRTGLSNRAYGQRFALLLAPFTSTTITYRNPTNGTAGPQFFWGTSNPTAVYQFQDIAYTRVGATDRIYSVQNFEQGAITMNLYTAWSDDFGVTVPGANTLTLNRVQRVTGCRIAGNANASVGNLAICFVEDFTASPTGDRDTRMLYTTTGGATTGAFTLVNPEFTTDTTQSCDIQSLKGLNSVYKIAYQVRRTATGGAVYYRGWSGSTLGTTYLYNNINSDYQFARPRAGYVRNNLNDSCLAVWSGVGGINSYASYGCQSTVGIGNNNNGIPTVYSLSQNYPNPFNPTTNIKFAIPKAGFVKIAVYDVMGREVAILVNENLNAGNHTADYNASALSSGVYFYKLTAGDFTDTKKMMLIK